MTGAGGSWIRLGVVTLCLLSPSPAVSSPEGVRRIAVGPRVFTLDAATLPDADRKGRTYLFLTVSPESEPIAREAGAFKILATFSGDAGTRIPSDPWVPYPPVGLPGKIEGYVSSTRLPAGKTRVRIRIHDQGSEAFGELDFAFEVHDFTGSPLAVSDLVFGLCGDEDPPVAELPVRPRPSRSYGDDAPRPCVHLRFAQAMSAGGDSLARVEYTVRDRLGKTVETSIVHVPARTEVGRSVIPLDLDGLIRGEYGLEVEVSRGDARVRRAGRFRVDETRIAFGHEGDKLRTVLGYVATNRELLDLQGSPRDSLGVFWARFWARRDPNPRTPRNEALIEFLDRVDHAARNFGAMDPGWQTDRGRIHIRYGAADRVERIGNDPARPPTEIWYYYDRNATFVFQDVEGFGRYRLAGSRRN